VKGIKLRNEEYNDVYSSPNIIRLMKSRRMGWAEHVEYGRCFDVVGKSKGKRPLGRTKRKWVDNINVDLQEMG